jgi:hypothetical protein
MMTKPDSRKLSAETGRRSAMDLEADLEMFEQQETDRMDRPESDLGAYTLKKILETEFDPEFDPNNPAVVALEELVTDDLRDAFQRLEESFIMLDLKLLASRDDGEDGGILSYDVGSPDGDPSGGHNSGPVLVA